MHLSDHIADNVLFNNRHRSPAAQLKVGLWFFATNKQCSLVQSSCFSSWVAQCIFSDPVKEERTATFTRLSDGLSEYGAVVSDGRTGAQLTLIGYDIR